MLQKINTIVNIILLGFSLVFIFLLGEIATRYLSTWLPTDVHMNGAPLLFSESCYWLHPNSGSYQPLPQHRDIQYHYYFPHLRDTPVISSARHILVLGDSFTFGHSLPWQSTYVAKLQEKANEVFGKNKFQFLNAATGGWGAADYLKYLEDFGEKINPKFVLIFLNTDDIARAVERDIYRLADNHSLTLSENFHPLAPVSFKTKLYNSWVFQHSALIHLMHHGIACVIHHGEQQHGVIIPGNERKMANPKDAVRLGEAIFLKINVWCKRHDSKLIVVTTGFNAFYNDNKNNPNKIFFSKAPAFFKKENIAFYDIAPLFKLESQGKNFQISGDQHPNALGAKIISQTSWPCLQKQLNI